MRRFLIICLAAGIYVACCRRKYDFLEKEKR